MRGIVMAGPLAQAADAPADAGAGGAVDATLDVASELVSLSEWSLGTQAVVLTLAAVVLALTAFNYRKLAPTRRRVGLMALRATSVVLLVALFYQPALLEEHQAKGRTRVAVLVDVSESMDLPHGEASREAMARRFLRTHAEALEQAFGEASDVVVHPFASRLGEPIRPQPGGEPSRSDGDGDGTAGLREVADSPWPLGEAADSPWPLGEADAREGAAGADAAGPAPGRSTRLVAALAELRARYRHDDLGAVLILSDGVDTSPEGRRAALSREAERIVRELGAPVHVATLPDDGRLMDLAVARVVTNPFAFLKNATSLEALVDVRGTPKGRVTARLFEGGRELRAETIDVDPAVNPLGRYSVTFPFAPERLGKHVYRVQLDPVAGEIYLPNNAREVVVDVLRDKIRVLQIVGQPSWDERFLRNHLKQNPNVDLISFFILVSSRNVRPLDSTETALIPFPARELFEEELGGFDLVVFQNFNYGPFQTRQYLPRIADFVREGGAFVMVGGPLSMSAGGYYGTPITDVLPVAIPPGFSERAIVDTTDFVARLTQAGRTHPVTRLELEPGPNAATWEGLEALEGVNLVTEAHPDALVLVEHPELTDQSGAPHPVVAVREVAEGRSMVVATDSTWHWTYVAGQEGGDPRHYDTFWANSIRWLIQDPELDLVKARIVRETVPVGESAQVEVQAFRPDYTPAAGQSVTVEVRRRRVSAAGTVDHEVVLVRDGLLADAAGQVTLSVPLDEAGVHEVLARAAVVEGRVEEGRDLVVATDRNPELEVIVGDGRLVAGLAEASRGRVLALDQAELGELDVVPPRIVRVLDRRHRELWNVPWVLGLLALTLGAEWWLRRRYGFL